MVNPSPGIGSDITRWHEGYYSSIGAKGIYYGFAVHRRCSHGMDELLWFVNFIVSMN